MAKRRKKADTTAPAEEPGGGFGGLAAALAAGGLSASSSAPEAAPPPSLASAPTPSSLQGKVVVRKERKGHGGKTVTVLSGAGLTGADLQALAKELRKRLGAGARVDGATIVVQGDQRDGAARWLEGRGATVVIGN